MLDHQSRESEVLFISKFGKRMTPWAIRYYMVKTCLRHAMINDASVHTLRHTMATHYLAKGGDLRWVKEMLGHESLERCMLLRKRAAAKKHSVT